MNSWQRVKKIILTAKDKTFFRLSNTFLIKKQFQIIADHLCVGLLVLILPLSSQHSPIDQYVSDKYAGRY